MSQLKLEAGKVYASEGGQQVRIICSDRLGPYGRHIGLITLKNEEIPVVLDDNGFINGSRKFIVSECEGPIDPPIDTPVWVRRHGDADWKLAHYAGTLDGHPHCWPKGRTRLTSKPKHGRIEFDEISLQEPQRESSE